MFMAERPTERQTEDTDPRYRLNRPIAVIS